MMQPFLKILVFIAFIGVFSGCGTPALQTGDRDPDVPFRDESHASSLIEVSFGPGETEVTKNIPEDAVHAVQKAVKSMRNQPASEP